MYLCLWFSLLFLGPGLAQRCEKGVVWKSGTCEAVTRGAHGVVSQQAFSYIGVHLKELPKSRTKVLSLTVFLGCSWCIIKVTISEYFLNLWVSLLCHYCNLHVHLLVVTSFFCTAELFCSLYLKISMTEFHHPEPCSSGFLPWRSVSCYLLLLAWVLMLATLNTFLLSALTKYSVLSLSEALWLLICSSFLLGYSFSSLPVHC